MADRTEFGDQVERLDLALDAMFARRDSQPISADADVYPLVEVGAALRELPREGFRERLKAELERAAGTAVATVNPVRKGFRTLTPYFPVRDVRGQIEFMTKAFGAAEICHFTAPTGGVHAEVRVGESMVMVGGGPEWRGTPMPTSLWMYVEDADAAYERALAAGAKTITAPVDQPYGDREAGVTDPAGNQWYISTHKGAHFVREGMHDLNLYLHPTAAAGLAEFVQKAFGAEVIERHDAPDGSIVHATMRIGNSAMGMGEAHGVYANMPTMIYMYVPDVDATYARALAAGAEALTPVTEQMYCDRNGMVQDAWGNRWYIATRVREP